MNRHGFESWASIMDLNSISEICFAIDLNHGLFNIGKHKYSWVLNIIRCVYLKVDRWDLNKMRCDKKKYPNNGDINEIDVMLITICHIVITK